VSAFLEIMARVSGFEPAPDFLLSDCAGCGYADCEMCRAANALQAGRLRWLELALNDAELQRLIVAWSSVPNAIRKAVVALIGSQE
jgi:hypothetical protein